MTENQKPINGHDPMAQPTEDQPLPAEPTELELANERVGKMMQAVMASVAQSGQFNGSAIIADSVLFSQQLRVLCELLFESRGDLPPLLDRGAFNTRLGELCAEVTENLQKPNIAIAVGDALRPKR